MIRINLIPKKEDGFSGLSALGVDLSQINIKLVLLAIVLFYGIKIPFDLYAKGMLQDKDQEKASLETEKNTLQKKVDQYKEIEKQIQEIVAQGEKLQERKKIIENRLQSRKSPVRIMIYIAKNIPDDLWIEKLTLADDSISIEGETPTYKSISAFIEGLKNSVYFVGESLSFDGATTNIDKKTGMRTEKFKISGKIARYH